MSVVLELFCIPHIYSVTEVLITCNCLDDIVMYKWTITTRRSIRNKVIEQNSVLGFLDTQSKSGVTTSVYRTEQFTEYRLN